MTSAGPCAICHKDTFLVQGRHYVHKGGDSDCGTGDGSTAFPADLYEANEAFLLAREQEKAK